MSTESRLDLAKLFDQLEEPCECQDPARAPFYGQCRCGGTGGAILTQAGRTLVDFLERHVRVDEDGVLERR